MSCADRAASMPQCGVEDVFCIASVLQPRATRGAAIVKVDVRGVGVNADASNGTADAVRINMGKFGCALTSRKKVFGIRAGNLHGPLDQFDGLGA